MSDPTKAEIAKGKKCGDCADEDFRDRSAHEAPFNPDLDADPECFVPNAPTAPQGTYSAGYAACKEDAAQKVRDTLWSEPGERFHVVCDGLVAAIRSLSPAADSVDPRRPCTHCGRPIGSFSISGRGMLDGDVVCSTACYEARKRSLSAPSPETVPSGWYCPHCERGVPPSEATYEETHTVCGTPLGAPPAPEMDEGEVDAEATAVRDALRRHEWDVDVETSEDVARAVLAAQRGERR